MTATLDAPAVDMPTTVDAAAERGSAYPPTVADLLPRAQTLAAELGERPSRRRLMRDLRVGGPKADALLTALDTTSTAATTTTTRDEVSTSEPSRRPDGNQDRPLVSRVVVPAPTTVEHSDEPIPTPRSGRRVRSWPVWLLALPAFVAIWSGWVGLGELTGFGTVRPLPGIADWLSLNTAITLPIGMETYAAFALRVWLSGSTPVRARRFARWSAVGSLALGAAGQVAYHLMSAAGVTSAPWPITAVVACLPVAVLGMGAALAHLLTDHSSDERDTTEHGQTEHGEAQS